MAATHQLDDPAEVAMKVLRRAHVSKVHLLPSIGWVMLMLIPLLPR